MDKHRSLRKWLQRAITIFGASRPGAWLLAPILHRVDRAVLRLTGGRHTLSGLISGFPTVIVTATGARSGKPRSVPLFGIPAGEEIVLVASSFGQEKHPAWYHNVRANPEVEVSWGDGGGRYLAREVTGEERERYWQKAVAVYPGFAVYRRRANRRIPVIVLSPRDPERPARTTA